MAGDGTWITTTEAAVLLGTTGTTVRKMGERGHLEVRLEERTERRRWSVRRASVASYLAENGRLDVAKRNRAVASDEASSALLDEIQRDRARLAAEVLRLQGLAIQLRVRNEALDEADAHRSAAMQHLQSALREQAAANDSLRRAIAAQDEALGSQVVPDVPADLQRRS